MSDKPEDCGPAPALEEDAEYQRQLALFVRSSIEKGIELVKIGEILSGLKRGRFLDVGAGGGDLTIPVSQSFAHTTVVEPNPRQAEFFQRRCPHFEVINSGFAEARLGEARFDFILCSHVLYYVEAGSWTSTIERMHDHLAPGGGLAIVLQSPIGEVARFFNRFASYDVQVLELWRELIALYGDQAVSVRYFLNEIWTPELEDMVDIGLFLLLDPAFKEHRSELAEYFEAHHRVEGGYRLVQDEILLAVKKK